MRFIVVRLDAGAVASSAPVSLSSTNTVMSPSQGFSFSLFFAMRNVFMSEGRLESLKIAVGSET